MNKIMQTLTLVHNDKGTFVFYWSDYSSNVAIIKYDSCSSEHAWREPQSITMGRSTYKFLLKDGYVPAGGVATVNGSPTPDKWDCSRVRWARHVLNA